MTESVRAVRAAVQIGSLTVDGFMLPDGSYRMSQTQVVEAAGLSRRNVSDFLRSNAGESLLGEGYTGTIFECDYYERLLREHGIDPWRIPGAQDEPG
ncbi:MAG: hypothetical protein JGK03_15555 [Microcoleus sp. PH2017_25_DOB_D_A]|jgi:hypothetical protein|uniref:hypothetical protein n=1 Tax=unclassified Microcoleus TaxID=2642155 RepID=UPI001DF86F91|nr:MULTISPECIES: hypothetical protein [unclassified Microcoleus]MCC3498356.1 hypothetical protein [Microcoleus sp. PH2017_15_JOR_U_A]MCC3509539.1 hypothetical protein [Microcoleus sp. PH2017_17_BER_D_A]MCC3535589.1 hypothetical protein [Microcoleus sp. PH2017_25_DOB_D_A]MCC3545442.1 hypothetical protein [Microcoleus sp. PH2017_24_DOB_U_A]